MGNDRAGEFGRGQQTAFDMHMPVAETGDHIAAIGLDDLCLRAATMAGIRSDKGDAAGGDGNVMIGQGFTCMDVHPDTTSDDHIGRATARRCVDKLRGDIGP